MKTFKNYPIQELKLIYNILHAQLPNHPELIDSEFLQDLQRFILQQAESGGVDITQPIEWANWLTTSQANNAPFSKG
jgi:hypothetical protein